MPRKNLRRELDLSQIIESKTRGTRSTRSSTATTTTSAAAKRKYHVSSSSSSSSSSEDEKPEKRARQSSRKTTANTNSKNVQRTKRRVGKVKSYVEPETNEEPKTKPKRQTRRTKSSDLKIKKTTKVTPLRKSDQSEEEEEEKQKKRRKDVDYKELLSQSEDETEEDDDEEDEVEDEDEEEEDEEEEKKRKVSFLKKKRLGKALSTATPTKKKPILHAGRAVKRVNQISEVVPLRRVNSITSSEEQTSYALARERLHVSAVPDSLPCREEEFVNIMGFVESAIQEGTGTCVYISGVPGTGKTATVLEVIRHLQQKAEDSTLPEFDFVEINGMKLTDPNQAYSILWDCVDHQQDNKQKKRYTPSHALHLLETEYISNTQDQRTTVVLMDELDLLVTKKQTVMYNFFDWPSRPLSKLIVIAVANTMDLPERLMSNKIASRMGLTRINFQPYNYNQLYQIVQSRLEGINAFGKEAVEFAARKVSAVSGDARRALDICRRSVEIVETRLASSSGNNGGGKQQVTIAVVDEAIKEMFTSPAVAFVRSCSLHQKIFLVSCMQRVRSIGLAEIEFGDVAHNHVQTCKWHNIEPPNTSDLMRVCESLGQSRALVMESGSMDIHMRLSLNLVEEDILMACKADKFISMLLQKLMSIE